MQHILIYSDSLTWGVIPGTRRRLNFGQRWPGVMETELRRAGQDVRIIENCLNGRRTAFEDPNRPGRNGLAGIQEVVEMNSPLDLVVLMLGTNDFQADLSNSVSDSAAGIESLVRAIQSAQIEPGCPVPRILVVAPPLIGTPIGQMAGKFRRASKHLTGLADEYEAVARRLDCEFFDAGSVVDASDIDGIHLDADSHATLGEAIAESVIHTLATSLFDVQTHRWGVTTPLILPTGTALVVIDVQQGLDDPQYGPRSTPQAEANIAQLVSAWRKNKWPVAHIQHCSTSDSSPLRPDSPGVAFKKEALPQGDEPVFQKTVNNGFLGTNLERFLRSHEVCTAVFVGLTIDHCVSTTARMSGDLGFKTFVVADATAAFGLQANDGSPFTAGDIHDISLVTLKDEFAIIVETADILLAM